MHGICEKCKLGNGFVVRLAGGVTTILCPRCTTDWHAFTRDHESIRKMNWANAVMQSVIQGSPLHVAEPDYAYNQARALRSAHSKTLFNLALEWLGRDAPC